MVELEFEALGPSEDGNQINDVQANGTSMTHPITKDTRTEDGLSATVKKFWEGPQKDPNYTNWVDEFPREDEDALSASENLKHAIVLKYRKTTRPNVQKLDSFIVRNKFLVNLIKQIIPDASSYYDESENGNVFKSDCKELFWYYPEISDAVEAVKDDASFHTMGLLLCHTIKTELAYSFSKHEELVAAKDMTFDMLWTIFKPGTVVLGQTGGDRLGAEIESVTYYAESIQQSYWYILYRYLDWNGDGFGWQSGAETIMEFAGRVKIKSLVISPFKFLDEPEKTLALQQLSNRGRNWARTAMQEPHMMLYTGKVQDLSNSQKWWRKDNTRSITKQRVVLDSAACIHYQYSTKYITPHLDVESMTNTLKEVDEAGANERVFFYCSPHLLAYSLRAKAWYQLVVTGLTDVVWDKTAYPSLLLPEGHKELVLSFAEAQLSDENGFDDVVSGKGKGLIVLLSGPAGTGKTLTAEATAEHMHRPLYSVSLGQLGADASELESALETPFELATRWKAVLLLDEADVFLEKRSDNDLNRNKVVGIMLSKIEYFQGVLFLTTNRKHSFDPAFKSRIHVSIKYPDLNETTRQGVWRRFIDIANKKGKHGAELTDNELAEMAKMKANGREIRNLVKSALLLASREGVALQKSHLDVVWKIAHADEVWADT